MIHLLRSFVSIRLLFLSRDMNLFCSDTIYSNKLCERIFNTSTGERMRHVETPFVVPIQKCIIIIIACNPCACVVRRTRRLRNNIMIVSLTAYSAHPACCRYVVSVEETWFYETYFTFFEQNGDWTTHRHTCV